MSKLESEIQKEGLIRSSEIGYTMFRVNVGTGWTGNDIVRLKSSDRVWPNAMVIKDPRPFNTGVPAGFSDTFGFKQVTITPEMVGMSVPIFTLMEYKQERGKKRALQEKLINFVRSIGGIAGFVRSNADIEDLKSESGKY